MANASPYDHRIHPGTGMTLTGRHLRILALAVLLGAVAVVLILPGPASGCHVVWGGTYPTKVCPAKENS
jgi:hypothetical protein